jgi:FkbM family methyltransferase
MTLLSRMRNNVWLLKTCRDWSTVSAMKLHTAESTADVLPLRFRALQNPVLYRPGSTDISVAWELFHLREYECSRPWSYRTVVDCGANVGMFLAFVLMKLERGLLQYAGVEADPDSFRLLERQVRALDLGARSHLIHAAAWHADGDVWFDDEGPSWARHVRESGGRRVRALSIDSILDEAGLAECDLLKLDIEGGERTVLPQMKTWGPRVGTVVAELHDGLDYPWFASIADDAGFEPYPPGALFRAHPSAVRRAGGGSSTRGASVSDSTARSRS